MAKNVSRNSLFTIFWHVEVLLIVMVLCLILQQIAGEKWTIVTSIISIISIAAVFFYFKYIDKVEAPEERKIKPSIKLPIGEKIFLAFGCVMSVYLIATSGKHHDWLFLGILFAITSVLHYHSEKMRVEIGAVVEVYQRIFRRMPEKNITPDELVRKVIYYIYPQEIERELLVRCLKKIERDPTVSVGLKMIAREKIGWIVH